jgi:pimeloyl-[acyl-carrier protein] methyl ester esterase
MPALLLLPGMDGTGRLFAPLIARLPPGIAATAVAYPGDRFLDYAGLLAHVQLPNDDFFVLGESFSGPLALRLAATRPPGLRGLILVATFATRPLWLPRWLHGLARPFMFGGLGLAPRIGLGLGRCPPEVTPLLQGALASVRPAVLAARVRAMLGLEPPRDVAALASVPTLILAARHDRLIGRRHVDALTTLLPHAEVAWFDAPHLLLQACPDAAAAAIAGFIARA